MKILVTGGAGFIGSHTCVELLEAGHDVVILDDLSNASGTVIDKIETITGKRPAFYQADAKDRAVLHEIFTAHRIDAVVHFAGFKAVGESCHIPLAYYRNNLDSTLALLEEMAQAGMIEQILRDYCTATPGFTAVLLRYFNPIGGHPSGLLGDDPNGIPNNLMPYIARVAAGQLDKLTIFGDDYPTPDGTCRRDYLHVVDLAKGHLKAIDYAMEHTGAEAFNLGTGHAVSVLELVNTFMEATGVNVHYVIGPRREGDLPQMWADTHKAETVLGWKAEKTVADMCRDSWNFVCSVKKQ